MSKKKTCTKQIKRAHRTPGKSDLKNSDFRQTNWHKYLTLNILKKKLISIHVV